MTLGQGAWGWRGWFIVSNGHACGILLHSLTHTHPNLSLSLSLSVHRQYQIVSHTFPLPSSLTHITTNVSLFRSRERDNKLQRLRLLFPSLLLRSSDSSMAVPPSVAASPASLYVGDLHPDVSDIHLVDAFSEFKSLTSVRVCKDSSTGKSLCYGYVNFVSHQDGAFRLHSPFCL